VGGGVGGGGGGGGGGWCLHFFPEKGASGDLRSQNLLSKGKVLRYLRGTGRGIGNWRSTEKERY